MIPQNFLYTRSCHMQTKIALPFLFQPEWLFFVVVDIVGNSSYRRISLFLEEKSLFHIYSLLLIEL